MTKEIKETGTLEIRTSDYGLETIGNPLYVLITNKLLSDGVSEAIGIDYVITQTIRYYQFCKVTIKFRVKATVVPNIWCTPRNTCTGVLYYIKPSAFFSSRLSRHMFLCIFPVFLSGGKHLLVKSNPVWGTWLVVNSSKFLPSDAILRSSLNTYPLVLSQRQDYYSGSMLGLLRICIFIVLCIMVRNFPKAFANEEGSASNLPDGIVVPNRLSTGCSRYVILEVL